MKEAKAVHLHESEQPHSLAEEGFCCQTCTA